MNVREIYQLIDRVAPFETQADFDNSGFLAGRAEQEVDTVLFALDVTEPVIDEALSLGADLIITHHPLMFSPRRRLTDEDYEGRLLLRLAREGISLIAAHTNLDQAPCGINDTLAELCGLQDVAGDAYFRCGFLSEPVSAGEYAAFLSGRMNTAVRLMGPEDAMVRKVGLSSGGGSDSWTLADETRCDAFISGEIKHHLALAMADRGIVGLECGHFATEFPGIAALAAALQNAVNTVECNLRIFVSDLSAYCFSGTRDRR